MAAMVGVGSGLVGGSEESQGSKLAVERVEAGGGGGGGGGRRWRPRGSATNRRGGAKLPRNVGERGKEPEKKRRKNHGAGRCVGCNNSALASSGMEYLFHTQGIEYKYTIYIYVYIYIYMYIYIYIDTRGEYYSTRAASR
jgi:hypothetical protein